MPTVFHHFWSGVTELVFTFLIVRLGKAAIRMRAEMLEGLRL